MAHSFLRTVREMIVFFLNAFYCAFSELYESGPINPIFDWQRALDKWRVVAEIATKEKGAGCRGWAVVTGGTSGIGLAAASTLAQSGYKVVISGRGAKAGEAARDLILKQSKCEDEHVRFLPVDMSDLESVRAFGDKLLDECPDLTAVICNAGIMATDFRLSKQGYESHMATNHLGHYLLLRLLEGRLKGQDRGDRRPTHVVLTSSCTQRLAPEPNLAWLEVISEKDKGAVEEAYDRYEAYYSSKLMNAITATLLHEDWNGPGVEKVFVTAVHPGCVATNIATHLPFGIAGFVGLFNTYILKTPSEGAANVLQPVLDESYNDIAMGRYFHMSQPLPTDHPLLHPATRRRSLREDIRAKSNAAIAPYLPAPLAG